ncbi:MAG: hypothetical protein Q8909_14920 [Bacteroidota bacterium]|nr:hypothetical protein [Bacteroidota bacterium]
MKKVLLIAVCLFTVLIINAQNSKPKEYTTPQFSLGLGSGINNYTSALGLSGNLKVAEKFFLQGGVGVGAWGSKYSVGIRYDLHQGSGWSYGFGYSQCSGAKNMDLTFNNNGTTETYKLDLLEASTINLKATRNWMVGKSTMLYIDLGYAVPLQSEPWHVTSGPSMSDLGKTTLNLMSPGGIIVGTGITFGL